MSVSSAAQRVESGLNGCTTLRVLPSVLRTHADARVEGPNILCANYVLVQILPNLVRPLIFSHPLFFFPSFLFLAPISSSRRPSSACEIPPSSFCPSVPIIICKRVDHQDAGPQKKKWMSRGEIERLKTEAKAEAKEEEGKGVAASSSDSKGSAASASADAAAASKKKVKREKGKTKAGKAAAEEEEEAGTMQNLPPQEVIRRLRLRGEPIVLFGENETDTFLRLRKLELEAPHDADDERQRNDLQAAMAEVAAAQIEEDAGGGAAVEKKEKPYCRYNWSEVHDMVERELGKGDRVRDQKVIRHFWTCAMGLWGRALEECRSSEEKRSGDGARNMAIFKQTELYIKPLLKNLKKSTTDPSLVPLLTKIVQYCQQREYQKANDAYEEMSIGKAAWPIGVTQVGIHSRGGRENIESNKQAHVLNDENTRKYIHAMKRLMTFCQHVFITDPSKSTEYNAMAETRLYPHPKREWLG